MSAFTYMGTKKNLAQHIAKTSQTLPLGPFLDLFSGISAAGASIGTERQVWCNDVQAFSTTLTKALYLSKEPFESRSRIVENVLKHGNRNLQALMVVFGSEVEHETNVLHQGSAQEQVDLQAHLLNEIDYQESRLREMGAACLFLSRFTGSYFGITQCVQLDSIRFGCDESLRLGEISHEEHRWCILAMCRVISKLSNSTGHFAQYLTARPGNISRVVGKRRRCAWESWLNAIGEMGPRGTVTWRNRNKVFQGDANNVLADLVENGSRPSIVYADPPYTSDQYSRFYHILDTAILYDYPSSVGKGQYREGRFTSKFSLKTAVREEFERMIESAAKLRAAIVISYPSNGLLDDSLSEIPKMLRGSYRYVRRPLIIPHEHSTMGASKGRQREPVEECIFVARH